ncbi:hypothetical protein ZIOFF_031245 [Zingiber officinale]|uniref:DUF7049 domain-containing protein n=1 Tax=Zingiber officinale TaxID=94328 RepID=A0A8J5GFC8_ZINOF|nr:hypothetical protein ZIOFF_034833 [Zingiber officinale]KAG6505932.1 hypothetical protein ZIOFF_031245 [Zingiber officinale]
MHSMIRALDSLEQEQFIYQEKPMSFGRQLQGVQFPADRDEAAIMAAMVAVIASAAAASSANSSSTSAMSNPAREACTDFNNLNERAFRPYSSALAPNYQEPKEFLWGQKMIKNSICFLRRVKRDQEPPPSTSSHQQHMKDKASVLIDARNYLKTLRAQILVLQEKNRKLEAHLPNKEMADQGYKAGNVQVEVLKLGSEEPRSQLEQIHIKIAVGVECNIVNLILHVLECLRGMRVVSIASVDARAYSPQMQQISAGANLKLQIKRCDWNEALFKEAMNRAVGGVAASVETLLVA